MWLETKCVSSMLQHQCCCTSPNTFLCYGIQPSDVYCVMCRTFMSWVLWIMYMETAQWFQVMICHIRHRVCEVCYPTWSLQCVACGTMTCCVGYMDGVRDLYVGISTDLWSPMQIWVPGIVFWFLLFSLHIQFSVPGCEILCLWTSQDTDAVPWLLCFCFGDPVWISISATKSLNPILDCRIWNKFADHDPNTCYISSFLIPVVGTLVQIHVSTKLSEHWFLHTHLEYLVPILVFNIRFG